MTLLRTFRPAIRVVFVLILVVLIVGNVLGQPILLSYVETDSMSPTLEPGDGFVAVPTALTGPASPGDVVVYRSQGLQPGELITHRVVDETDRGYVTRGDANPFTDQDSTEPVVESERIEAQALTVGGDVVVVPGVGVAIGGLRSGLDSIQRQLSMATGSRSLLGTSGLGYLLLGSGVLLLAASVFVDSGRRRDRAARRSRSRPVVRLSLVVLVVSVLVVGPATMVMALSSGTQTFSFVSSHDPSPSPTVVETNSTTTGTYQLSNDGVIPVHVYFEPRDGGVAVTPEHVSLPSGASANATVTIQAPAETGYYELSYAEHRYFAVLPQSVLTALHAVHPLVALATVDVVLMAGITVLVVSLFGSGPIPVRIRSRQNAVGSRLWKLLR